MSPDLSTWILAIVVLVSLVTFKWLIEAERPWRQEEEVGTPERNAARELAALVVELRKLNDFVSRHGCHDDLLWATDIASSVLRLECIECSANVEIRRKALAVVGRDIKVPA